MQGFSLGRAQNVLMNDVLPVGGGVLLGAIGRKQLSELAKPPKDSIVNWGYTIGGTLGAVMIKNPFLAKMSAGIAVNGVVGLGLPPLQKAGIARAVNASRVSLLPPGESNPMGYRVANRTNSGVAQQGGWRAQ